jgi:FAD/FMN-containing dehydrogenase
MHGAHCLFWICYTFTRQSCYEVHQIISWSNPTAAAQHAARSLNRAFGDAMRAFGGGGYVNTNSDDSSSGGGAVQEAQMQLMERLYGGNAERLLAVKKLYDPDNLFHHNSNIRDVAGVVGYAFMHE